MKTLVPIFTLLAISITAQAQVNERMDNISKECLSLTTSLDSNSYADRISKILDLKKEAIQAFFKANTSSSDGVDSKKAMKAYQTCGQAESDFWTLE